MSLRDYFILAHCDLKIKECKKNIRIGRVILEILKTSQFSSFLEEVWVSFLGRVTLEVLVEVGVLGFLLMFQLVLHEFGLVERILGFHRCFPCCRHLGMSQFSS